MAEIVCFGWALCVYSQSVDEVGDFNLYKVKFLWTEIAKIKTRARGNDGELRQSEARENDAVRRRDATRR